MNKDIVIGMVKPYLKKNNILFKDFRRLFATLSRSEQYLVVDILIDNNIGFITDEGNIINDYKKSPKTTHLSIENEKNALNIEVDDTLDEDDDFKLLYDDNIFKDKKFTNSSITLSYRNIKQSNEMLCVLIQQGNEQAKQDLCIKNKALVAKYVWLYGKKYLSKLSFEDMEQAGMIGLIKAAEKFDIKKGYAFTTYAVYWITQTVVREIYDTGFVIRLPVHMMERINKIAKLENACIDQGMTYEECINSIADELDLPEEDIEYCRMLKANYLSTSSLNTFVGEGEDTELMDFIPSDDEKTVEDIVMEKELRNILEELLLTLSEREQKVIRLRFGMDDDRERTLEEIGHEFNVTRERIRQIEAKAIKKMNCRPVIRKKLKAYLEDR